MAQIVEIKLDHHFQAKVYTPGSTITGHLSITTSHRLAFDRIELNFLGITTKRLELDKPRLPWNFLRKRVPLQDDVLPYPNFFEPHHEYTIPFHLTIPQKLSRRACSHRCDEVALRTHHLWLPPSMGGGIWGKDDLSPEMIDISYLITADILAQSPTGSGLARAASTKLPLKVLPTFAEEPPLDITDQDAEYKLSRTSSRGNILSEPREATYTASQPRAIMLSADGQSASRSTLHIELRCNSCPDQPSLPKVDRVCGKVVSNTYWAFNAIKRWPNLGNNRDNGGQLIPNYTRSAGVFSHKIHDVDWQKGKDDESCAASCASSTGSGASARLSANPLTTHTAKIDVEFTIPQNDRLFFLPTFHSCQFSRTYTLKIEISLRYGRSKTLAVPLQIGVQSLPLLNFEIDENSSDLSMEEPPPSYPEAIR